ncbi:MAG: dTMP kinase [Patescibacteria group bacterium]
MIKEGKFIDFEGGEGSGKSTQIRHLKKYFAEKYGAGRVVKTHEPGGGMPNYREQIFAIKQNNPGITDLELAEKELELFEVDRALHVKNFIRPKIAAGCIVLCDRFVPSTVAYQGYARGMNLETVHQANKKATSGIVPDLIILMDINPEIGIARKFQNQTNELTPFDKEKISFHERVRAGFLAQASADPNRWVIIDASKSETLITYQLIDILSERLGL